MNVLLTGASGKVGRDVCRELHRTGYKVVATDRVATADLPVPLHRANLLNYCDCKQLVTGVEAVVHLAAYPNDLAGVPPQVLINENLGMTANLLQAARESGVGKFLLASSVQAMAYRRERDDDGNLGPSRLAYLPADGKLPPRPRGPYGLSKQLCEDLLCFYGREYAMETIAFRFPALFKYQDMASFRRRYCHSLGWRPDSFDATRIEECFSCLSTRDAGRLAAAVLNCRLPGYRCYFPVSSKPLISIPVPDLIARYFADVELRVPAEKMQHLVDISQIAADTGWHPIDNIQV